MATVKTAVSIDRELFNKAEKLAKKVHMSRSRLYAQAVEYLITKNDNVDVVRELNRAYADSPDDDEKRIMAAASKRMAEANRDKW
jgi:metal-responsive CopG/Arc/MetJ family transcriptional regulator